jgi:hypothetical protein
MRRLPALAVPVVAALAASFAVAAPAHATETSYKWIGSSGNSGGDNHSWSDPNNWSPNGVPGDGDSATIASPDPNHCTAALNNIPTVTLAALSITQDPTLCSVSITGDGTNSLTVTGAFTWDGGAIALPVTLAPGSTGTITGNDHRLNGLAADLTVAGSLTMAGLTGTGADDASLRITNPFHLHVRAGGTLTSAGDNNIEYLSCCNNPAKIVNDGILEVDGGDLTVNAVEVDQRGTLTAADGGRLVSDAGPSKAVNGARYTGSGGWFIKDHANANLSGTQTLGANFHLELGGIDVGADAALGGTATFAGGGTIDWTGGTIEGNFTIGHGIRLVASGAHVNNGRRILSGQDGLNGFVASTVTNHGTMVFANGASVGTGGPAHLVNASDGTIDIAPGVVFASGSCCVNPDQFVNRGTVTVPSGTVSAAAELDNIAYKSTGTTSIAAGRKLLISGHAAGLLSGAALTGSGSLVIGTPMSVGGSNSVGSHATLLLGPGGSLNGTSTFSGAGSLRWAGGSFSGAVTVAVGGGTSVTGPDQKAIANIDGGPTPSKLTFTSHLSIASGTSTHHDGIDIGQSSLTLESVTTVGDFVDLYGGKLINTGTLTIRPGTLERDGSATTVNQGTVSLAAGATLQSSGTYTQTAGGRFSVHLAAQDHGLLSVQGTVALHGTVAAQDDGSYNPAAGKKVQVVVAATVTASPSCVITAGAGSGSRHWVVSTSANGLILIRKPGALRHC